MEPLLEPRLVCASPPRPSPCLLKEPTHSLGRDHASADERWWRTTAPAPSFWKFASRLSWGRPLSSAAGPSRSSVLCPRTVGSLLPHTDTILFDKITDLSCCNPFERTGRSGRGPLPDWGPNHLACPILLARIPSACAPHLLRMHLLLCVGEEGRPCLPRGRVSTVGQRLATHFVRQCTDPEGVRRCVDAAPVFRYGYLGEGKHNTDHAWEEIVIARAVLSDATMVTTRLCPGEEADALYWCLLTSEVIDLLPTCDRRCLVVGVGGSG